MAVTGLEVAIYQGRERAQVNRFTHTLDEVVRSLREIDEVYLEKAVRPKWVLASLSQEDRKLVVRLQAADVPAARSVSDMLVPAEAFVQGAAVLQEHATVPRLFRATTVTRMADLAVPKAGVQTVSVAVYNGQRGEEIELSDLVRSHAQQAVETSTISYGTVTGRVFAVRELSRPKRRVKLSVRDERTRGVIDAELTDGLAELARESWRHRYVLGGKVKRNALGQPVRMTVDRIESMPEDNSNRPATDDVLGLGADWFANQSVDDAIAELRRD